MSGILYNSLGYSSPNNSTDDLAIESNDRSVASTSLAMADKVQVLPCNEPSQRPALVESSNTNLTFNHQSSASGLFQNCTFSGSVNVQFVNH